MKITNENNMALMARYPDGYFELAIVDPPYGINIAKWDSEIPKDNFFNELFRVSKNQIVFGGNYFNLPHSEGWICWDKTFNDDLRGKKLTKGGVPRKNMQDFELAWTSFDKKPKILRFTQIGNLIGFGKDISVDYTHKKKIHKTQKHPKLYEWLLMNYAKEGDKILDTHLGSGSIAIACHNLGFDLTACELDTDYYNAAMKRINEHKQQLRLAI
jgi:site-specific DNA-methyltransferase (adenine-specific)